MSNRNNPGEEISVWSYERFISDLLRKNKGFMRREAVYSEIERHYRPLWGPDDLRIIPSGVPVPKWVNTVAWACKKRWCFVSCKCRLRGDRRTESYLILLDIDITPEDVYDKAIEHILKKKKKLFLKWCPKCGFEQSCSNKVCINCGKPFPPPAKKRHRKPEEDPLPVATEGPFFQVPITKGVFFGHEQN
jgi:hypothetical protein